jgi:uncharacterized protein (UPF0276 family)
VKLGRAVPVLLERDHHLEELQALLLERAKLQEAYDEAFAEPAKGGAHA